MMKRLTVLLPLITFLVFGSVLQAQAQEPIRVLIITGEADLPWHFWRETTGAIRKILDTTGRFETRLVEEPGTVNATILRKFDAVIINYNGLRWPRETEEAITDFVHSGGGLFAFHHSSYGRFFGHEIKDGQWYPGPEDAGWKEFPKMIGASWKPANIGHARRCIFEVDWMNQSHPVAAGLSPSFMANDELYHKLDLHEGVEVLADAMSPADLGGTGKREPLIWTNNYGKGHVFYTTLGHDTLAWYEPGMANLLSRGVEWAASGKVTLKPIDRGFGGPAKDDVRLLVVTSGHDYPVAFYSMLDSLQGVTWSHGLTHSEAFSQSLQGRFDVVLHHDMHNETSEQTRQTLKSFVESGGGVVSLHHAIVNYTDWPWWYEEVIGGKYFEKPLGDHPASTYQHDVEFSVTPVRGKERHPVLSGVGPLWVDDEVYKGMLLSPGIEVLMETKHPGNDPPVVYVGPHPSIRSVYIQLGHSASTMRNPGFQRLVENAVKWTARRID